ncbi:hypothetical protein ACFYY3_25015 [Streptomyces sp. NPDC001812]|uniref:Uncharacterized protein n=1 Tax=Streptomyces cathayae TaxID=3031124 RepID=A0ABY8KB39_9ACTN|nr:hypothetical protein [Streptomyces sp. HUAS 5]WGD38735.1 hypothetical protein PYS65_00265 [Streptomyces sp. HUAS 5]WGD44714.1 hypothetical protein PYS65_33860 [Streptomyces sp. HUAS 5]WGD45240.1 hypothetical protein PYS65_34765 [Streptomyces sp. HUAS 5]
MAIFSSLMPAHRRDRNNDTSRRDDFSGHGHGHDHGHDHGDRHGHDHGDRRGHGYGYGH